MYQPVFSNLFSIRRQCCECCILHGPDRHCAINLHAYISAHELINNLIYTAGAAAQAAEARKYTTNDQKCSELGWSCVPLAVESYGAWGKKAQACFALLASRLAVHTSRSKSKTTFDLYSRLNLALARSITRAINSRSFN